MSCSQDDINIESNPNKNTTEKTIKENKTHKISTSEPSNNKNPFDESGVIHNKILTTVLNNRSNLNNMDEYINYAKSTFYSDYNFNESETPILNNTEVKAIISDSEFDYGSVIKNSAHSANTKEQLSILFNLLISSTDDETLNYKDLKAKIINYENNILENLTLSKDEKSIILQTTSIARYSSFFWYNQYQQYLNNSPTLGKRKWWKWLAVAVADVAGAAGGALAASPTVIGAIGAGIGGAVGASAGASTLVDWISPD